MPRTVAEWVYAARLALWWAVRALAHWISLPAGLVVAWLLSAGDFSFFGGFVARGPHQPKRPVMDDPGRASRRRQPAPPLPVIPT